MNTYWGDMHTHTFCGGGTWRTIEEAAVTAKEHLDFWAPGEHHDNEPFDWGRICKATAQANEPGRFVSLPGQEVGTGDNGDFNVYYPTEGAPGYTKNDLPEFFELVRSNGGIVIPHHIGYKPGVFGMQWDRFFQPDIMPLVEIFSMHGSSERDPGPYPMDLGMGPSETGGCALSGLQKGLRFGFIASCDGHNGYPGTYGMGLAGVKAEELTRDAIFDALRARRTWGVTGDRIDVVRFRAGDGGLGAKIPSGQTELEFDIEGLDTLDCVDVVKNGRIVRRFSAWEEPEDKVGPFVSRICWGWGRVGTVMEWSGRIVVSGGTLRRVAPIFGPPAPDNYHVEGNTITFSSVTGGYNGDWTTNRYRCGGECGFCLVIDGDLQTRLRLEVNGIEVDRPIGEMMDNSEVHCLPVEPPCYPFNAAKLKIYQCLPASRTRMRKVWTESLEPGDFLYLRVRQDNGQMAWLSPIFAEG